jgi:phosphoglycolate phosphatase
MSASKKPLCVLFDLDGTLVDTAPDLITCLNEAFIEHGLNACPISQLKQKVSFGIEVMIDSCVDSSVSQHDRRVILEGMLTRYEQNIAAYSQFFEGMPAVLAYLDDCQMPWGIVTNKRERFTHRLVDALGLTPRLACAISGDTTPHPKPHPAPLFEASKRVGVAAHDCVYIGDAQHDIVAGKQAGMMTLVAAYGYLQPDDVPQTWGADGIVESPLAILDWLQSASCC